MGTSRMKKVLLPSAIFIILVLIMPMLVFADLSDVFDDQHYSPYIGYGTERLSFRVNRQNNPVGCDFFHPEAIGKRPKDMSAGEGYRLLTNNFMNFINLTKPPLFDDTFSLPGSEFIAEDHIINTSAQRVRPASITEFGMMKKVLEPNMMLLLGSCLLGLGLFAVKFRK